ncbi:hypothetical protein GOP47_0004015 [Adiantum capillus-veneris]|uniref:Protein kinase domain-containing protein n=1 Tax=Adiantum capillus-veneris TaxID=13818 RepID=A0A9D4V8F7_ADICA|nr:hypothetical protein GOP47_0004015 [Adiantum capillus-veneris]
MGKGRCFVIWQNRLGKSQEKDFVQSLQKSTTVRLAAGYGCDVAPSLKEFLKQDGVYQEIGQDAEAWKVGPSLLLPDYDGTLSNVANKFQANENDILWYSRLNSTASLKSGQPLRIPFGCGCGNNYLGHNFSYTVVVNDTASTIATQRYQFLTTVEKMTQVNAVDLNVIFPSNILHIPVNCSCGDPSVNSSFGLFLTYISMENDNAGALSQKFNVSAELLQSFNKGVNLDLLQNSISILFVPVEDGNGTFPPFNSTGLGNKKSNSGVIIGASVSSAVLFLAVIAVLFYICKYRQRKKRVSTELVKYQTPAAPPASAEAGRLFSEGSAYTNTTLGTTSSGLSYFSPDKSVEFSYRELSECTNNFSIANKIGQGGYGSVYYGQVHGQKLAIKMMNMQATKEFLAELKVLTRVHHTNLVRLVGFCTHESLFLVYEYVENGTLSQHLKGSTPLAWEARIQVALDAARGLEYIHEHTTPTYIHRDIKSSNILLDNNNRAKVADFGLTKLTESGTGSSTIPSRLVGTFGYMAPEYARFGDISAKSDVYSFGVVLFEIISAKDAIVHNLDGTSVSQASRTGSHGLVTLFEEVLSDTVDGKEKLRSLIDPALGDDYPLESVWKMATLAGACTREEPLLRPNMRVVVVALMTLSSSTQDWEADHGMQGVLSGRKVHIEPRRLVILPVPPPLLLATRHPEVMTMEYTDDFSKMSPAEPKEYSA